MSFHIIFTNYFLQCLCIFTMTSYFSNHFHLEVNSSSVDTVLCQVFSLQSCCFLTSVGIMSSELLLSYRLSLTGYPADDMQHSAPPQRALSPGTIRSKAGMHSWVVRNIFMKLALVEDGCI